MNTKKIIAIFVIGIIILLLATNFLIFRKGSGKANKYSIMNSNNVEQLDKTDDLEKELLAPTVRIIKPKEIALTEKGADPMTVIVKKGEYTEFKNTIDRKIEVKILGYGQDVTIPIKPNNIAGSLPFSKAGKYTFYVAGDNQIKGEIIVK